MKRYWMDAIAKLEDEEWLCRVCGTYGVEAAHITKRIFDEPRAPKQKMLYVKPESIVPLCREHHTAYDAHQLDIIEFLHLSEQLQAARDYGSITLALQRLAPSAYRLLEER